jgi:hypothetical protein
LGATVTADKHPCVFVHVARIAAHWRVRSFSVSVYQRHTAQFRGSAHDLDHAYRARQVDPTCASAEAAIVITDGHRRVRYVTTTGIGGGAC